MGPLWVDPVWESLCFLDLDTCLLSQAKKFSAIIPLHIFLAPFFLSLFFWGQYNENLTMFYVVPEISLNSYFFSFFLLFSFSDFHSSVFQLTNLFLYHFIYFWFLLFFHFNEKIVYFSFQLLYCLSLVGSLHFLTLLKTSDFSLHPFFSWALCSFSWSLLWTLYKVDCLSSLHLGLMEFNLAPLLLHFA